MTTRQRWGAVYFSLIAFYPSPQAWATNITSNGTGPWSLAGTWNPAQVPTSVDAVTIRNVDTVTVDITTATASTTTINGTLTFSRVTNSSLTMVGGNITVTSGGTLDMGNAASPIPSGITVALVLAYGATASQYGLIINVGGSFFVQGSTKTPVTTAAADALAGAASISVNDSGLVGWQVGDSITIGQTHRAVVNQTELLTITSLTGSNPLVVGLSSTLSYNHKVSEAPIRVGNLTRNVVVLSSGTSTTNNSAYIQSLVRVSTSLALAYGEFAYLGSGNGSSKHGLTLDGGGISQARGSISSCTIRNGYIGIFLDNGTQGLFSYNLIYNHVVDGADSNGANNSLGLFYSNDVYSNLSNGFSIGNQNTLDSNNVYSNASYGILLTGPNNTLTRNNVYAQLGSGNSPGIQVNSDFNILEHNQIYSNSKYGLTLSTANNGVSLRDYIYSNLSGSLNIVGTSTNNVMASAALGYDAAGNSYSGAQIVVTAGSSKENLTLEGARINPAGSSMPLLPANYYLFSYEQDYDTGSIRIWGDYGLSGSTLTLDYANQLYPSTASAPKIMWGNSITSIKVNSTNDANAVSQLITVTFSAADGLWHVVGSVSGALGTLPGSGGTANFPSGAPQFNLTLAASGAQDGDKADFALVAASGDSTQQKKLLFGPAAASFNGGKSKLTIDPLGGLALRGTPGIPTLMDWLSASSTFYTVVDSGAFTAVYSSMTNMDNLGLQLSGSAGVSLATSTFDNMGISGATNTYITARALTSNVTFYGLTFGVSRSTVGAPSAFNVFVDVSDAGLSWLMREWSGALGGEAHERELGSDDVVRWTPFPPQIVSPTFLAVYATSFTVTWGLSDADGYEVDASTAANFSGNIISSVTLSGSSNVLSPQGLLPNTTYYVRIGGLAGGVTNYAAVTPATATLPSPVAGRQLAGVFYSSITVNWTSLPLSPPDASSKTAEGYRLDASTAADFSGTVFSSSTASAAQSTLTVTGLATLTTYYLRVGSLNWDGVANYVSVGSTTTLLSLLLTSFSPPASSVGVSVSTTVILSFNKVMSLASLNAGFSLAAVLDKDGDAINQPVSGSMALDASGKIATFTPASALGKNDTYQVILTTAVRDTQGLTLASSVTWTFSTLFDHNVPNTIVSPPGPRLSVPANGFPSDGYLVLLTGVQGSMVQTATQKLLMEDNFKNPVQTLSISAFDATGAAMQPASPPSLILSYALQNGFVAGANPPIRDSTLALWVLDPVSQSWNRIPGASVDSSAQTITSPIPHFSIFALIGGQDTSLANAHAYPVPYVPSKQATRVITFTNLSSVATIRIYTVDGILVRTLDVSDGSGQTTWDVNDSSGRGVASGVYLYSVTNSQEKSTGKLVIIK